MRWVNAEPVLHDSQGMILAISSHAPVVACEVPEYHVLSAVAGVVLDFGGGVFVIDVE